MNRCVITGNVGSDAQVRQLKAGGAGKAHSVVAFSIGDSAGRGKDTTWWNVSCWIEGEDVAATVASAIRKGERVRVEGFAKVSEYAPKDGPAKQRLELSCSPRDISKPIRTRDFNGGGGDSGGSEYHAGNPPTQGTNHHQASSGDKPVDDDVPF